jgi:hypothetical protein
VDITQSLKNLENALRDFIAAALMAKHGPDWVDKAGLAPERVKKWKERREEERKKQGASGLVDERIIYYADFTDLFPLLKKNWSACPEFAVALGELKQLEVYLGLLEKLRDPDAHRRELLPHHDHLILGICGEIGTRLARYRSKMETDEDCWARFESASDNLGQSWAPSGDRQLDYFKTARSADGARLVVRVGAHLEWVASARDPLGRELEYQLFVDDEPVGTFGPSNKFSCVLQQSAKQCTVSILVRPKGEVHLAVVESHDDEVTFYYQVLPPARTT